MKIVVIAETYSRKMGYSENCLSKELVRQGHQVHLITTRLHPYSNLPDFKQTFKPFAVPGTELPDCEQVDGYTVHYLPHKKRYGYIRIQKLWSTLKAIRPDIVQTFVAISWIALDAALYRPLLGYRLFTGSHTTASTFPLARLKLPPWHWRRVVNFLTRFLNGRFVGIHTEKCYAVTVDCADIAIRFFGVPRTKVAIVHLGVDQEAFFPVRNRQSELDRNRVRCELGIAAADILCIYTGKLNREKNALLLAEAVARLRQRGEPYCALFIGDGVQRDEIRAHPHCLYLPFMQYQGLGNYYRAADIGVWLTNESTSMLDAAACGIPIIVSDGIIYRDHVNGNGLVYRMNDLEDLISVLLTLKDANLRSQLGAAGAAKMARDFNWTAIAGSRVDDYRNALAHDVGGKQ